MAKQSFEDRLFEWNRLRKNLEHSVNPIEDTVSYWQTIPCCSRNCDPYDSSTWPSPWEMIEENSYCEFTKLLAIAYTLKLTDKFKDLIFLIKIGLDKRQSRMYYLLCVGDQVVAIDDIKSMHINQVPKNIHIQKIHQISNHY